MARSENLQPKTDAWYRALDQETLDQVPLGPRCPAEGVHPNSDERGRRTLPNGATETGYICRDCGTLWFTVADPRGTE